MVKTLKDMDAPEPWFGKKNSKATFTPKQTRAASKQMAQQRDTEDANMEEPSAKGEARDKGKRREDLASKGRKKAKAVRPGAADLVMGRSKYAVPDPAELRRKMIEDAEACGRVVKTLSQPTTRKSCPAPAAVETPEGTIQAELINELDHVGSPDPAIPDAENGMDKHAEECGNEVVRVTPSSARVGKETYNEDIQLADELGVASSGKRKAMRHEMANSSSTDGMDPGESAQKHRRLNRSPSPIVLKERVSHTLVSVHFKSRYCPFSSIDIQFRIALNCYICNYSQCSTEAGMCILSSRSLSAVLIATAL